MRAERVVVTIIGIVGVGVLTAGACASRNPARTTSPSPPTGDPVTAAPAAPPPVPAAPAAPLALAVRPATKTAGGGEGALARFHQIVAAHPDMSDADLMKALAVNEPPETPLGFDPTRARHYRQVSSGLLLTADEVDIYRHTGVVSVDTNQQVTMAQAYLAIYEKDLPVLITSDSVLHAWHKSFDQVVMQIELSRFRPALAEILKATHEQLRQESAHLASQAAKASADDADVYLTVARCLLAGDDRVCPDSSVSKQTDTVRRRLADIAQLQQQAQVDLYGARRVADLSQFKPRGHYNKDPDLQSYFRTMMWLGRPDVGFEIEAPRDAATLTRQQRSAALVTLLMARAQQLPRLLELDRAVTFLFGVSDNVAPRAMAEALVHAGVRLPGDLDGAREQATLARAVADQAMRQQQIRGQFVESDPRSRERAPLPVAFQVFGQRFAVDSFLTAQLVYDSILFHGEKQQRTMPSGLDVMAALGNNEALTLLRPEIQRWNYGSNLFAARSYVQETTPETWNSSVYNIWLSALAKLDDVPPAESFPKIMTGQAWRRKQLQTQLSSWSELRHDAVLYTKESETGHILCEYPAGYVEPYPDFFARLAILSEQTQLWLGETHLADDGVSKFLGHFAGVMRKLEGLARKELAAQPFSKAETEFIKDTISASWRNGDCGPPTAIYSGWYPTLFFGKDYEAWEPTIVDVHTDSNEQKVLEVGVGSANYLVAAIDSEGDRMTYVGPAYSYYEFTSKERLTDEEWRMRVATQSPARPAWARPFQGPAVRRSWPTPKRKVKRP